MTALLELDTAASTVRLAGETLPAAHLICPRMPWQADETEWDCSLPSQPDLHVWVPAENGCIFEVSTHNYGLGLAINYRTCRASRSNYPVVDEPLWLPASITLVDGCLIASEDPCLGTWHWEGAEPDWVLETILRLGHKPVTLPPLDGPAVILTPLSCELDRETPGTRNRVVAP